MIKYETKKEKVKGKGRGSNWIKSDYDKKKKVIGIRLRQDEYDKAYALAIKLNTTVSKILRSHLVNVSEEKAIEEIKSLPD